MKISGEKKKKYNFLRKKTIPKDLHHVEYLKKRAGM